MCKNPYYEPEKMGLTKVAEIEYTDQDYQFDTRVVWRHDETGKLYTARDSGCSCPTPFEDFDSLEKLEEFSVSALECEARDEAKGEYYGGDLIQPFLEKIRGLSREEL